MAEREDEHYNPADKFGTPEDAPQTYLLNGKEVSAAEWSAWLDEQAKDPKVKPAPVLEYGEG